MNEQLEQALTGLITRSLEGIDAATGFLAAEIPDVVAQLLMWHGVYNFILMLLGFSIAISCTVVLIKKCGLGEKIDQDRGSHGNHKETWTHDKDGDLHPFSMIAIILALIVYPMSIMMINLEWLQIWIAPKVWLLEYAANLTK